MQCPCEARGPLAPAQQFPLTECYDLITTFDCIHDMARPQAAIEEIDRRCW